MVGATANNPRGDRQWQNTSSSSTLCTRSQQRTQRTTRSRLTSPAVHMQPCTQPEAATATADPDMVPCRLFVMTVPMQTKLGSYAFKQWHFQLNDCCADWILLKNKSVYLSLSQFNATGCIKHWAIKHGTKAKLQCYREDYAKKWHGVHIWHLYQVLFMFSTCQFLYCDILPILDSMEETSKFFL